MDLYKYLCLFGTPVGVTDLILIQNLYLYGLMFIQDSRRSYRTYTETGLIRCRSTRRYYGTYTETKLIRYRSTRRYYRTYTDTGVPVGTTGFIQIQEYPSVLQNISDKDIT